jgi:hypothetical protein
MDGEPVARAAGDSDRFHVERTGVERCVGYEPIMRIAHQGFTQLGLSIPSFFGSVPGNCAFLWFFPFALQLGWLRAAIWVGLIGIATALTSISLELEVGVPLLPCIAMVGRRTRPWMAIPAVVALFLVAAVRVRISPDAFAWPNALTAHGARYAAMLLPYAAILIFGTNLIPKKLTAEATG